MSLEPSRLATLALAILGPVLVLAVPIASQERPPIVVEPVYDVAGSIASRGPLELALSRLPDPGEGRLAVLVGGVDLTDLFSLQDPGLPGTAGPRLRYRAELLPLPPGQAEIVVYLVDASNRWSELARLPLRVRHRGGFDTLTRTPRLDLTLDAELDAGGDDAAAASSMDNLSTQLDFQLGATRGRSATSLAFNIVGASEIERALRFGTEGEDAPRIDLSSYRIALQHQERRIELGAVAFGDSRHLIQAFSSRGLLAHVPLGRFVEIGAALMHGTAIVGWDNPIGLDDSDHQILSGRLAVDALAASSGDLRLELTLLDGTLRPLFAFNRDFVNDREENQGWSLRLTAATPAQRLRLDAGTSSSDFTNPADPLLAQGADLVPVRPEERSAHFVDADLGLIQGAQLGERFPANVRLGLHHERVEPQYRSVAAYTQADLERNAADLTATLGPIAAALAWSQAEDNLDRVPSVLTTHTEQSSLNLAVPFGQLRREPRVTLPILSYSLSRVHQIARDLPIEGDFSASHLPDQVSLSHTGGLQWAGPRWSAGYQLTYSDQDNRQAGRENADFETSTHAVRFTFTPHARLDLGLDLSRERGDNLELAEVQTTDRLGLSFTWRVLETLQWSAQYSGSDGELEPFLVRNAVDLLNSELSWRFQRQLASTHALGGQVFLRFALQDLSLVDPRFGVANDGESWRLTTGVNLNLQ